MLPTDHLEEPDVVEKAKQHQTDDSEPSEIMYVATMETSVAENPKSTNGKILPFVVGGTKQTFAQQLKSIEDQVQKLQGLEDRVQKLTFAQQIKDQVQELQELHLEDRVRKLQMVDQFNSIKDQLSKLKDDVKWLKDDQFRTAQATYEIEFDKWVKSKSNKRANRRDSRSQAVSSHQPAPSDIEIARQARNLSVTQLEGIGG